MIGVGYYSDMVKVKALIDEILNRDKILKSPTPRVLMQNFNESSVDFRVLFWIENMDMMLDIRNEVMIAIFQTFKENGIEIPFPKRDLYIKNLAEEMAKVDRPNTEDISLRKESALKVDKKNPPNTDPEDNLS